MDASRYAEKLAEEVATFASQETVHDLPAIHHYYVARHVVPLLRARGYETSLDFFVRGIEARRPGHRPVSVVSYGAGNAEMELRIAGELVRRGVTDFHVDCIDINADMLARARARAAGLGVGRHFTFVQRDVADTDGRTAAYDVHLACQVLHHLVDLEGVFAAIDRTMDARSVFLIDDVIGRNGHMRWPETLVVVEALWRCLLRRHRYNHQLRRMEPEFVNFDCSDVGFEGVRAQDVLPLLVERFAFEESIAFGGIVDPFVDRSFGPNFDPERGDDARFIDYVCAIERGLAEAGVVKPTRMLAKLRKQGAAAARIDVARWVRRGLPAEMPRVDDVQFAFARDERVLQHTMCGDPDDRLLAEGFFAWEAAAGQRWTARVFSLRVDLPAEAEAYDCRIELATVTPGRTPPGGATVFANRVRIARVEDVFAVLAASPTLAVGFETFGGPTTLTVVLDHAQRPPDEVDRRELGIIVRAVSVYVRRR